MVTKPDEENGNISMVKKSNLDEVHIVSADGTSSKQSRKNRKVALQESGHDVSLCRGVVLVEFHMRNDLRNSRPRLEILLAAKEQII